MTELSNDFGAAGVDQLKGSCQISLNCVFSSIEPLSKGFCASPLFRVQKKQHCQLPVIRYSKVSQGLDTYTGFGKGME
jgi:hypothetical protein